MGSGSDPESRAGRQPDGYGGWCLEVERMDFNDSIQFNGKVSFIDYFK